MSISLTLINKSIWKRKIGEVVSAFDRAIVNNYTESERDKYVSKQGKSCLSVLFQADGFEQKESSEMIVRNVNARGRNIVLIKKVIELGNLDDFCEMLGGVSSPFVVLELTKLISGLEMRPPWILSDGQLIFPVGMITPYFVRMFESDSLYGKDSRGFEFAKGFLEKDQSEIATAYYDKFVREGGAKELTDPKKTGLIHFTTMVTSEQKGIQFSFMQNRMKTARYFFEPNIMFCSNEVVARSVRRVLYPNMDILIRNNLRFYEVNI